MEPPETRYVKTPDGAHIAYQVFGNGPFDLVYVPGFASNVEYMWRVEPFARGLRRLGSLARVIVFDRRGTDSHDTRPSQSFDIWAQLDHTPGKLGLLTRLCLEPDIDMNRLGHLVLSNVHRSSAEVVSVGP